MKGHIAFFSWGPRGVFRGVSCWDGVSSMSSFFCVLDADRCLSSLRLCSLDSVVSFAYVDGRKLFLPWLPLRENVVHILNCLSCREEGGGGPSPEGGGATNVAKIR